MARASYDASIIQEFAQRLYDEATSIIFWSSVFGLGFGALIAAGGVALVKANALPQATDAIQTAAVVGAVIGLIGP